MRKMYVMTRSFLFPSARALAISLSDKTGVDFRARSEFKIPDLMRNGAYGFIRWGNSSPNPEGSRDCGLNQANWISLSGNKGRFSKFLENNGINVIEFHKGEPERYPIAVRKTLTGMGGEGIEICRNSAEFYPYRDMFWSYWYKFSFELGVHILDGNIVKIMKKIKKDGSEPEFPIRNLKRGYHFSRVREENYPKLQTFVTQLHAKFQVDYARLDIGWDSINKVYRAIEMNSAPGLTENEDTLEAYASYIVKKLGL